MRSLLVFVVLASGAIGQVGKSPVVMPKLPPAAKAPLGSLSPAGQLRAAALDMSTRVRGVDQPFTRYVSLYAVPEAKLPAWTVLLQFLLNTVSQGPDIVRLVPVPDTGGRLFRLNINSYRWNADAFSAGARRDPYFREPMVPHRETEFLRQTIGVAQDEKTFAAEAIVEGTFLMRDILQPDGRSETYYDLLYAEQRFGKASKPTKVAEVVVPPDPGPEPELTGGTPWKGGVYSDGKFYPAGAFKVWKQEEIDAYNQRLAAWKDAVASRAAALALVGKTKQPQGLKKNFPADLKDWEEFWGVEGAERFGKDRGFVVQKGEIVAGARNAKGGRGSFVAYNDRVIVVTRVPTGYHLETYDTLETKNDKDYIENPLGVVDGKINADAGELLVNLPNGLQASLLVAGGKRVEFADSRVARNTADARDVTVRTQIGCIQCHAVDYGFISPTNRKLRESLEAGLKFNTLKEEDKERISAFFLDWEKKEQSIRSDMEIAVRKATRANPLDPKDTGWTGAQVVAVMVEFRDWYDEPVGLEMAASVLGEAKPVVFLALTASPLAGLNLVAVDKGMPRLSWDATGAVEAGKLLALLRVQFEGFLPFLFLRGNP